MQVARVMRNKDIVDQFNQGRVDPKSIIKPETLGARINRSTTAVAKKLGVDKDQFRDNFFAERARNGVMGANQHTKRNAARKVEEEDDNEVDEELEEGEEGDELDVDEEGAGEEGANQDGGSAHQLAASTNQETRELMDESPPSLRLPRAKRFDSVFASSSDAGQVAASPKPNKRKPSKSATPPAKKPATRKRKVSEDEDDGEAQDAGSQNGRRSKRRRSSSTSDKSNGSEEKRPRRGSAANNDNPRRSKRLAGGDDGDSDSAESSSGESEPDDKSQTQEDYSR